MKVYIPNRLKSFVRPLLAKDHFSKSYSQCGEDLILNFAFRFLGIDKPSYLDIGAHHPEYLSNTAFFYKRGCHGVNIEPDRGLFNRVRKKRRRDVNLNIGVSDREEYLDFYVMSASELNTFSKEQAEYLASTGNLRIIAVDKIKVEPINKIMVSYFTQNPPNLLSIDVEGLELKILKSLNFYNHAPLAICAETLTYKVDGAGMKNPELLDFLQDSGYFIYADTFINTIFFHKAQFDQMKNHSL